MSPDLPTLACLAALAMASPALANDSAAQKAAGGLVLVESGTVAMESEDLTISPTRIDIAYVFRNAGDTDETLTVAFPLPPIEGYGVDMQPVELPRLDEPNFVGFTVEVEGERIEPDLDEQAYVGAANVTELLEKHAIPLNPLTPASGEAVSKLSDAAYAELEGAGLLAPRDFGEALWRYEASFHFDVTFPAGEPVEVRHSYQPVAGMSFLSAADVEPGTDLSDTYCIDAGTRKALGAVIRKAADAAGTDDPSNALAFLRTVPYILTTANNWSGPIGRFHLTIDKAAPGNVVSLCENRIEKIGPTRFEVTFEDYTPARDLAILFAAPDPANFQAR
ncbi:hypothetical protein ASG43_15165 [Aureimonas sp. Leaf454]|uniref:DUF4424 family protein n=1 Tax=Aureimonas sp. Leaf454 TaxID=1736381 RepID=UPI000700EF35|nr:DUF4424 family protein [Aureimonas sp. Leaf454]KQT42898.1 hypothetical protein ASG43_15165 [Aureimonas sp. Leaf454]